MVAVSIFQDAGQPGDLDPIPVFSVMGNVAMHPAITLLDYP